MPRKINSVKPELMNQVAVNDVKNPGIFDKNQMLKITVLIFE